MTAADQSENERQYRLIFEGNPTPALVFDHETLAFLEVNDAAVRLYGYGREEFLGLALPDLRPPDSDPDLLEYLHRLVPTGTRGPFAGIWLHRKKDGSILEAEVRWSPILFRGREASLALASDVTLRRQTERRDAALAKMAQRLSARTSPAEAAETIRNVCEELFASDVFTLDLYSPATDSITPILNSDTDREGHRLPVATMGGTHAPSGMARRVIEDGAQLILREEPMVMPADVIPFGDTSRPSTSLMLVQVRNRTRVIGILSVQTYRLRAYSQHDLTTLQMLAEHCGGALERIRAEAERNAAEQALTRSEMLFHSIWDNSVDGMRLTDSEGRIVAVNRAYCKMVGLAPGQAENQPFIFVLHPSEPGAEYLEQYRQRFRQRLPDRRVEGRLKLHDGRSVVMEKSESFVEMRGEPPLLLALLRDITAQRQLEEQLRQSQKMEAIGQLAGGVAHDFNNLLTVIHGHASMLREIAPDPAALKSARQILVVADRAAGLTRQLLAFGRPREIQPRVVDLNHIVSQFTRLLGRILGEDIDLRVQLDQTPAQLNADSGMLEQVLMNLSVNARDAMPHGGTLTLTITRLKTAPRNLSAPKTTQTSPHLCLTVTDTGCGIPPENLSRIFEPFFTTKSPGKGTGLGLATVYGIVKQHQGWVEVDSKPSQGSTFRVYLPAMEEKIEAVPDEASQPPIRGGGETILVVEDEGPVREMVCEVLREYGYRLLEAETGVKALSLWKECKDRVDLVLTDLVMPDALNGRELAEKLWIERPELKVIFTSGYSADVVGGDFQPEDGRDYLQKPYHPRALAAVVRDCLDRAKGG